MLFSAYMGKTVAIRKMLPALILLLVVLARAENTVEAKASLEKNPVWMQVEVTIVPLRADISRNGAILGFARKGQVLAVEKATEHWVKVRANDSLEGWVPQASMSPSGPPVNWSPDSVKGILMILTGLAIAVFLYMTLSLQRKRKLESQEKARQAMADAKRRLQNKIQVLFRIEPRIHSNLSMDEVDLLAYLRSIGYVANLEKDPEQFLRSCKTFKPNLILAEAELQVKVEDLIQTDAQLINTPVVYLHCGQIQPIPLNRVRTYLEANATDQELLESINFALRKSPEKILYSIKAMALKGGINAGTLMDLLHFLSAVKKTGQLQVESGNVKGNVHFLLGNITRSGVKNLTDEDAVHAILDLTAGAFEFHEMEPVADGNAGLNTEKILMDWARKRDENNHHTGA